MASQRQIDANRRNAEHSTGPKTDEGKEQSRKNAQKHGLTGDGIVLSEEDAALVAHRLEAWRSDYDVSNDQREFLFHRLVLCSVRADRCASEDLALRSYQSERADTCWDDDRAFDAEELADALSRRPALIARRLSRTKHGCEWILDRWRRLDHVLKAGAAWDEAQKSLVLDLLGVPKEFRTGDLDELIGVPTAVVERESAVLQRYLDRGCTHLDQCERELAKTGQELKVSPERRRLRRYEAASLREYYQTRALLLDGTLRAAAPEPPAAPPPPPEPTSYDQGRGLMSAENIRRFLADPSAPFPGEYGDEPDDLAFDEPEDFPLTIGQAECVTGNRRQRRAAMARARSR